MPATAAVPYGAFGGVVTGTGSGSDVGWDDEDAGVPHAFGAAPRTFAIAAATDVS